MIYSKEKILRFLTKSGSIQLENELLKIDDDVKKAFWYEIIYAGSFISVGLGWIIYNEYVGDVSKLSIISVLYGGLSLFLEFYFSNHDKEITLDNVSSIKFHKSNDKIFRSIHIKLKNKKTRILNLEDDSNIAQLVLNLKEKNIHVTIE